MYLIQSGIKESETQGALSHNSSTHIIVQIHLRLRIFIPATANPLMKHLLGFHSGAHKYMEGRLWSGVYDNGLEIRWQAGQWSTQLFGRLYLKAADNTLTVICYILFLMSAKVCRFFLFFFKMILYFCPHFISLSLSLSLLEYVSHPDCQETSFTRLIADIRDVFRPDKTFYRG